MSSIFAIMVFIAFNVVPADQDGFQIVDPAGKTSNGQAVETVVEFTRQPDGAWRMLNRRRDRSVTCALNGKMLTVTPPEDEQKSGNNKPITLDVGDAIRIAPDTDWSTVSEFMMHNGGKVTLTRQPDQVTVDLVNGAGADAKKHTFQIRWKAQKAE